MYHEMLTSWGFPASTCKICAPRTSFKARAGNWCRKAFSQQSVCSLGLDLVSFRASGKGRGLCCPPSGSRGVHPCWEDGCQQEGKELTVDSTSLAPSPAFPGKGQELAASSSEEGVGGNAKGACSSAESPPAHSVPPTSADQLFRANPEGRGRLSNKCRGRNECGIHYGNLATHRASLSPLRQEGGRVLQESWRRRRPWAGARGWGCEARVPSLPPQLSPRGAPASLCLGLALPLRAAGWSHVPASLHSPPTAPALPGENGLAPLAPATYGLLFGCTGLSPGGWAGRGQKPLPGRQAGSWRAPEGCLHPFPGVGRTPGERPGATVWDTA